MPPAERRAISCFPPVIPAESAPAQAMGDPGPRQYPRDESIAVRPGPGEVAGAKRILVAATREHFGDAPRFVATPLGGEAGRPAAHVRFRRLQVTVQVADARSAGV